MATKTQKMTIVKRGRKYFTVKCGRHVAQLVINSVSENLKADDVVSIEYNDISETNSYGTKVKFEPVAILEELDADLEACKKWIFLANRDVEGGLSNTNACRQALAYDGKYQGEIQDRIDELKDAIETASEAARLHEEQERAFELEETSPITKSRVEIKGGGAGWVGTKIHRLNINGYRNQTEMIEDNRSRSHRSGSMIFEVPTTAGVYVIEHCGNWRETPSIEYILISNNGKWYDIVPSNKKTALACLESLY